ncbi:MAG: hypothetical protein QHH15_04125 [Candidatus Thermoplasmatota archaeon]|jgi:hypothetical protein|nr:hypothetical protein [Candidatus Thermoplasmatota archaeon]
MNNITKKLQKLVENRKTSKIVSKQSAYKPYSRTSKNNISTGGEFYIGSEEE